MEPRGSRIKQVDMLNNRAWFGQTWSVIGRVQVLAFMYVHTLLRKILYRDRLRSRTLENIIVFKIQFDNGDTG